MSDYDRYEASVRIARKLTNSAVFHRARHVGCYLSTGNEVVTAEIILRAWRMKKRVFAPVCEKNSRLAFREVQPRSKLGTNQYGIAEPVGGDYASARMLDVVIAPVVAFDANNNRIGMGGGYFDRAFAFLRHRCNWRHPKLLGVAFACQQAQRIIPNPWDVRLFGVVTEASDNFPQA